jgi:hypothetical protein
MAALRLELEQARTALQDSKAAEPDNAAVKAKFKTFKASTRISLL